MKLFSPSFRQYFILLLILSMALPVLAQPRKFSSVEEALRAGRLFSGNPGPQNIDWFDNGNRFSYLQMNPQTRNTEIRAFTVATLQDELIFDGEGLTFPGTEEAFDYDSFQWAADSRHILFQANFRPIYRHSGISDYYFYSVANKTLQLVASDAGTAELSPDGTLVGFERGGDMYIFSFETGEETRLTHDASEFVFNGRFGWVYEEEFSLAQAWSWSNDSRFIAFWQEDETEVPIFQMTNYEGQHNEYVKIRYPKVGDVNPTVRIGVVDVRSGRQTWLDTGEDPDSYIPRIYWTADPGKLAVVHLSRDQTHLRLYLFDVNSGNRSLLMEEKSQTWIDIQNYFEGSRHSFLFPSDAREFFWLSDRDGFRHIYRFDYTGKLLNQVTKGNWDVASIEAYDRRNNKLYYVSTEASALERHLYVIGTNGRNKSKITKEEGRHRINMSPNARFFIDRWSNVSTPLQVHLKKTDGSVVRTFEDNRSVLANLERFEYSRRELFSFTTEDGQKLDGMILKPSGFDENVAYPMVLDIYGGPSSQSVYNDFETNMWRQYLAQQGYVVVSVNNRGSSGYGRDFEKVVYKNLGHWEAVDFSETAKYLASKSWIDSERMAIRGHSYGGYMVLYAMTSYPGLFQTGLCAAPVSDWRLYDTLYPERYMGLLGENEDGYIQSSPTTRAENLKGRLLLVHSSMDEHVHVQHTFQFAKALIDNKIDHDLRIFPPGAHGVAYDYNSYMYLMDLYVRYLDNTLK